MNREIAESLMAELMGLSDIHGKIAKKIEDIEDDEERKRFRTGIAMAISDVYGNLIAPIARQYPDLDPIKDSSA